jgi:hypothetical protein
MSSNHLARRADCLPMFSTLGARMLIAEVHAASKAAAVLSFLLPVGRQALCGSRQCSKGRGADSAADLEDFVAAADVVSQHGSGGVSGGMRSRGSAWTSASTVSLAAFAGEEEADDGSEAGAPVPMYPPGRILWLLPNKQQGSGDTKPASASRRLRLYEVDQACFRRFLVTLDTATYHLPDSYIAALDGLGAAA